MAEWQPIETAPKDGQAVWVRFLRDWYHDGTGPNGVGQDWISCGRYRPGQPSFSGTPWRHASGAGFAMAPTHWLPRNTSENDARHAGVAPSPSTP